MIPKDLTKDIINRLHSIKGQMERLIAMLEEGKDPDKILLQFKSTDSALQKARYELLDEVYRKTLAIKIADALDNCPGNCGYEDRIEYIKQQFPHLKMEELTEKLREMKEIEERLSHYKTGNK